MVSMTTAMIIKMVMVIIINRILMTMIDDDVGDGVQMMFITIVSSSSLTLYFKAISNKQTHCDKRDIAIKEDARGFLSYFNIHNLQT